VSDWGFTLYTLLEWVRGSRTDVSGYRDQWRTLVCTVLNFWAHTSVVFLGHLFNIYFLKVDATHWSYALLIQSNLITFPHWRSVSTLQRTPPFIRIPINQHPIKESLSTDSHTNQTSLQILQRNYWITILKCVQPLKFIN